MNSTGLRSGLDRPSLRVAGLVGVGHAVVVLWIRSALSVISMPLFDPYVVWAFVGLTLVGGFAAYVFLMRGFVTPALGIGVFFLWIVFEQWQYVASLDGLAWAARQPLNYYTTYWPLPLLVGLTLTVLEWGGRKLLVTQTPTAE